MTCVQIETSSVARGSGRRPPQPRADTRPAGGAPSGSSLAAEPRRCGNGSRSAGRRAGAAPRCGPGAAPTKAAAPRPCSVGIGGDFLSRRGFQFRAPVAQHRRQVRSRAAVAGWRWRRKDLSAGRRDCRQHAAPPHGAGAGDRLLAAHARGGGSGLSVTTSAQTQHSGAPQTAIARGRSVPLPA